jgi:origin recognition complex subunit 4
VPDSDDEEAETLSSKPKKLDFGKPLRESRSRRNLYDVPDSGDELDPAKGNGRQEESSNPATPSKRRAVNRDTRSAPSRSTTDQRDRPVSGESVTHNQAEVITPRKRGRPPKPKPKPTANLTLNAPAVKARIYGNVGRADSGATPDLPGLKGILSPQKKKAGRPRKTIKTVVFDEADNVGSPRSEGDITPRPVLADVASRSASQRVKDAPVPLDQAKALDGQEKSEEEHDDDEVEAEESVCVVCSKPDSEPPNEIIFCEVCDRGFHQECYNVPVIPEGDWICRTCSQDDILPDGSDIIEKEVPITTSTKIPEIPNFEHHFQRMRRTLLDRCSGNSRIKLRGQSEAYYKAYQLVEQTVLAGEGNSMMVIGGRGCGKTTVGLLFLASIASGLITITDDGRDYFQPSSQTLGRFPRYPPQWFHPYRRQTRAQRDLASARQGDGNRRRLGQQGRTKVAALSWLRLQ